jgi:hypothetical protein
VRIVYSCSAPWLPKRGYCCSMITDLRGAYYKSLRALLLILFCTRRWKFFQGPLRAPTQPAAAATAHGV